MEKQRKRYQNGSLTIEKRKTGPSVWVYRWYEQDVHGKATRRKYIVGSKTDLPSRTTAKRKLNGLRLEVNRTSTDFGACLTIGDLSAHYCGQELSREGVRTTLTCKVYLHHIERVILPRWKETLLKSVVAIDVERWLAALPGAPATKAKTRNVLSTLFRHAMRHGWTQNNPIEFVRQSAKRRMEPDILTVSELNALLHQLQEPAHTIVLAAALTGMRRGELFGLKWADVDFENKLIRIRRSLVDQVEGKPKTASSRRPIPMDEALANALRNHHDRSQFGAADDWVFASNSALGRKPLWPDAVLKRHVAPAARVLGITKRVGWHTFRRTTASLLLAAGASVKVSQELMGHASPIVTLGTYAQAVSEDKRTAQCALSALILQGQSKGVNSAFCA